jgi:hypothetical protein
MGNWTKSSHLKVFIKDYSNEMIEHGVLTLSSQYEFQPLLKHPLKGTK